MVRPAGFLFWGCMYFWALLDGRLVVVLQDESSEFWIPAWECPVQRKDLTLLEEIKRPPEHEGTALY